MGETADDCGKLSISTQKAVVGQSILRGDEKPEQLQDKFDWNAITNFEVENENGSKLAFSDVFYDTKTIVIFIRVNTTVLMAFPIYSLALLSSNSYCSILDSLTVFNNSFIVICLQFCERKVYDKWKLLSLKNTSTPDVKS